VSRKKVSDVWLLEPQFPEGVDRLNEVYDGYTFRGSLLQKAGERVAGYTRAYRPESSDGYGWFWALMFRREGGVAVVCFPGAQDWDCYDDSQMDRSIALYALGVYGQGLETLIAELVKALADVAEEEREQQSELAVRVDDFRRF